MKESWRLPGYAPIRDRISPSGETTVWYLTTWCLQANPTHQMWTSSRTKVLEARRTGGAHCRSYSGRLGWDATGDTRHAQSRR